MRGRGEPYLDQTIVPHEEFLYLKEPTSASAERFGLKAKDLHITITQQGWQAPIHRNKSLCLQSGALPRNNFSTIPSLILAQTGEEGRQKKSRLGGI